MATATRKHSIVNPARRRKNKPRRKMSAKQIRHFGTKAQKAALKRKRHTKRSVANPRRAPKRAARRVAAKKTHRIARRRAPKRENPGEILSLTLGNPGGRRSMAKRKRKNSTHRHHKKTASRRRNPGRKMVAKRRHLVRRNPGASGIVGLLTSGVFAAGGLVLSRFATQAILGAQNAGFMGYAGNAVATAALAFATHMVSKNPKNRDAVILGGVMGIIARLITDYTPYGQFLQAQGFGDYGMGLYLEQNDPMPSRLVSPSGALVEIPSPGWAPTVMAPAAAGMGNLYGGGSCGALY